MLEFFIAALVVAVAPGPDNLFVLAQSATHGAKAGFCVICGLCTGIVIQVTLLVLGVSALIAASPKAFFVMQCLGAAYLLYLAYKSFRVRAGTVKLNEGGERLPLRKLYLRGIIMNITNPKAYSVRFCCAFGGCRQEVYAQEPEGEPQPQLVQWGCVRSSCCRIVCSIVADGSIRESSQS